MKESTCLEDVSGMKFPTFYLTVTVLIALSELFEIVYDQMCVK